jgi:endonuclease/exonuclease/phosphatase family metal-dependent hydrolase
LKVLHWNIHRGWGTDGKYDLNRIGDWIVKMNPHVVSLNEVQRFTSYANEDQPGRLHSMLESKTGAEWYLYFRTPSGSSRGHGNAILSRFPIVSTSYCELSGDRVAANIAITVNGRLVNFYSTHLNSSSSTGRNRIAEVKRLLACLGTDAEQKIIAGDFNARDYTSEIGLMEALHRDGWAESKADGTAVDYAGNSAPGATRKRRIDYVWYSKRATAIALKKAQMFDTRNARGSMPSDHKPLVVTFEVR